MAACDAAPDFQQLVDQIATEFGAPHELAAAVEMDDRNPDWDVLYPFSQVFYNHLHVQCHSLTNAKLSVFDDI
jgi:hypothetical protein